jgi:hypothetical protein
MNRQPSYCHFDSVMATIEQQHLSSQLSILQEMSFNPSEHDAASVTSLRCDWYQNSHTISRENHRSQGKHQRRARIVSILTQALAIVSDDNDMHISQEDTLDNSPSAALSLKN